MTNSGRRQIEWGGGKSDERVLSSGKRVRKWVGKRAGATVVPLQDQRKFAHQAEKESKGKCPLHTNPI
jgi:hypothetical protein